MFRSPASKGIDKAGGSWWIKERQRQLPAPGRHDDLIADSRQMRDNQTIPLPIEPAAPFQQRLLDANAGTIYVDDDIAVLQRMHKQRGSVDFTIKPRFQPGVVIRSGGRRRSWVDYGLRIRDMCAPRTCKGFDPCESFLSDSNQLAEAPGHIAMDRSTANNVNARQKSRPLQLRAAHRTGPTCQPHLANTAAPSADRKKTTNAFPSGLIFPFVVRTMPESR